MLQGEQSGPGGAAAWHQSWLCCICTHAICWQHGFNSTLNNRQWEPSTTCRNLLEVPMGRPACQHCCLRPSLVPTQKNSSSAGRTRPSRTAHSTSTSSSAEQANMPTTLMLLPGAPLTPRARRVLLTAFATCWVPAHKRQHDEQGLSTVSWHPATARITARNSF